MKSVIIFGSKYGSSRQYAEMLSQNLQLDCFDYKEFDMSNKYDVLIYIGSLYAGGVKGLSKTLSNYPPDNYKKLIIVTVGIADPKDLKNAETIKTSIYKQLPKKLNKNIELFHIRGSLDYSKLNLQHSLMMKLVYQKAKKVPIEQRDEEINDLITTYNKKVDFIDFNYLRPLIDRYLQIEKEVDV
ncbi:MAG: flavodoxin domain-containing protein [Christensenellales bacterium]|nr:flavodoxin domain-containing protein [Christensenellales bacterium]